MYKNNYLISLKVKTVKMIVIACLITVTGCKKDVDVNSVHTNSINPHDTNYEHTFWVKQNNNTRDFNADETGYIISTTKKQQNKQTSTDSETSSENLFPIKSSISSIIPTQKQNINNNPYPVDTINNAILEKDALESASLNFGRAATINNLSIKCEQTEENYEIGQEKDFYLLMKKDNGSSYVIQRTGKCKYIGENCFVWFINNNSSVVPSGVFEEGSDKGFDTLGKKFDSIIELEESISGSHKYEYKSSLKYIDSHDKINIVVADLYEDAYPEQTFRIYGYCWYEDLFSEKYTSNHGNYIYIDSFSFMKNPKEIYSTITHEFNHLLNYINKKIAHNQDNNTWFTEMLSLVTEDYFQEYLGLTKFDSSQNRLGIFDQYYYAGFYNWRNGEYVLASYASAYAFGAYLARNFGGLELIHQIATNPYVNEEAITEALKTCNQKYIDKNGVEQFVDFQYAIENFYKVLINTNFANDNDDYITLNRQIGSAEDQLYFTAIDLCNTGFVNENNQNIVPLFFPADKSNQISIGAKSFVIHHIGADIENYKISKPKNEQVKSIFFTHNWGDILR